MPLILFQSTPARERATGTPTRIMLGVVFQSTPARERATFVVMILSDYSVVSIHARSRAGDVKINKEMLKNRVSIHARSRAGDYGATQTGRLS